MICFRHCYLDMICLRVRMIILVWYFNAMLGSQRFKVSFPYLQMCDVYTINKV